MTTEQPKAATPQDQPYPPPMVAYPNPHFTGGTFPPPPAPPGTYQPHFFAYAPPDGTHPEANGASTAVPVPQGPPLVYPYPPGGMLYYPPHPPGMAAMFSPRPRLSHLVRVLSVTGASCPSNEAEAQTSQDGGECDVVGVLRLLIAVCSARIAQRRASAATRAGPASAALSMVCRTPAWTGRGRSGRKA